VQTSLASSLCLRRNSGKWTARTFGFLIGSFQRYQRYVHTSATSESRAHTRYGNCSSARETPRTMLLRTTRVESNTGTPSPQKRNHGEVIMRINPAFIKGIRKAVEREKDVVGDMIRVAKEIQRQDNKAQVIHENIHTPRYNMLEKNLVPLCIVCVVVVAILVLILFRKKSRRSQRGDVHASRVGPSLYEHWNKKKSRLRRKTNHSGGTPLDLFERNAGRVHDGAVGDPQSFVRNQFRRGSLSRIERHSQKSRDARTPATTINAVDVTPGSTRRSEENVSGRDSVSFRSEPNVDASAENIRIEDETAVRPRHWHPTLLSEVFRKDTP